MLKLVAFCHRVYQKNHSLVDNLVCCLSFPFALNL